MTDIIPDIPNIGRSYPAGGCQFTVDKTGTLFWLFVGNADGRAWGYNLYRKVANGKSELLWYGQACTANLSIFNNQLWLAYTDGDWRQHTVPTPISGYIGWGNEPSGKVVNVDESALNAVKQSIATVSNVASNAQSRATNAQNDVTALYGTVKTLEAQVQQLKQQVATLQSQIISKQTVEDIVWQKIIDMNYLYRLAFIAYPNKSPDEAINQYVNDLVLLIRKVK